MAISFSCIFLTAQNVLLECPVAVFHVNQGHLYGTCPEGHVLYMMMCAQHGQRYQRYRKFPEGEVPYRGVAAVSKPHDLMDNRLMKPGNEPLLDNYYQIAPQFNACPVSFIGEPAVYETRLALP